MKYCPRCGLQVQNQVLICPRCGLYQAYRGTQEQDGQPDVAPQPFMPVYARAWPAGGALPYFIWSLVLFFFINIIGTPLSIAAAYNAASANDLSCKDRFKKLYYARAFCIAATVVDLLTLIIMIAFAFINPLAYSYRLY